MKKTLIIILMFIITASLFTGCGNKIAKKDIKENNKSISSTTGGEKNLKNTEEMKKIGDPKTMDDSEFSSVPLKGEDTVKLDNIDSEIEDLGDLDSLINAEDPLKDIPNN